MPQRFLSPAASDVTASAAPCTTRKAPLFEREREGVPDLPLWTTDFLGAGTCPSGRIAPAGVTCQRGAEAAILTAVIPRAASADARELEARVAAAYDAIAAALGPAGGRAGGVWPALLPIRFWNFIPDIHGPVENVRGMDGSAAGITRYMAFNAGRFAALDRWRSAASTAGAALGPGVAAATGVGHHGEDLVVHCLAASRPGRPVENPRQVPAYRYSRRWGPLPPCFARGTLLDGAAGPFLLVGGTASVRGEASVHAHGDPGDLVAQVRETLANLACLIEAGLGAPRDNARGATDEAAMDGALRRLSDVRIYYARAEDRAQVAALTGGHFAPGASVEFVRADICRPELLVEIEGVAGAPPAVGG